MGLATILLFGDPQMELNQVLPKGNGLYSLWQTSHRTMHEGKIDPQTRHARLTKFIELPLERSKQTRPRDAPE